MAPAPAPLRFALDDGGELRALRWLGRVVFVGSWWPLWYAFFGKLGIDGEALSFGAPACVLGLVAWLGSGTRIRTPPDRLEVDGRAGEVRLVRAQQQLAQVGVRELGAWQLREWRSGAASRGIDTTWYAVRFAGLGEHDLFSSTSREDCEAWATRVDAAARGEPLATRRTLADLLAARFDALLTRVPVELALLVATLVCMAASVPVLAALRHPPTAAAIVLAIAHASLALGFRARGRPGVGIALALLAGLAFASKPWLAPVEVEFMGRIDTLSPSAETHFYFLIPGLLLIGEAVLMVLTLELRPASAPTGPSKPAPVELPAPEPRFPRPDREG